MTTCYCPCSCTLHQARSKAYLCPSTTTTHEIDGYIVHIGLLFGVAIIASFLVHLHNERTNKDPWRFHSSVLLPFTVTKSQY